VKFLGSHYGRWPLIAALLEKAGGMSDADILARLGGCTPRELARHETELLLRRQSIRAGCGHVNSSFIDSTSPGSREYETLVRLTGLVQVAISRKTFEKPTDAPEAKGGTEGKQSNESARVAAERKALLQAYVSECAEHRIRVTDRMIAEAARPTWHDRTPVQRWKRNDRRCTPGDDSAIRAVLKKKPHLM
jgi:hypothetical protein